MKNKTLGWGLIITLAVCFMAGVSTEDIGDNFYFLFGVAIYFFGIWGGINLIKSEKEEKDK